MNGLKPIKKPVTRKWYFVKFSYEHLQSVPRYDATVDDVVQEDLRVGPVEVVVNQLAKNEADAYQLVRDAAAIGVHQRGIAGASDGAKGTPVTHVPIEGTVIILGVEEWVPKPKKEEQLTWL